MNMHPLIALADTIPLDGDPLAKLRAAFEKYRSTPGSEAHTEAVCAMLLGEYILAKRQSGKGIFPIPPAARPMRVSLPRRAA